MDIVHQGPLQFSSAVEIVGFQYVADLDFDAQHHPTVMGQLWWCQAVFNAKFGTDRVKLLVIAWCARP